MALLERVSTLLRANLNDLLDKAEDPEKLSKQILLDMENQLVQVKTQVAVVLADQHRLLKQQKEHEDGQAQWRRKAELAVTKGEDGLARAALERSLSHERLARGFAQQHMEQTAEAETLRAAYSRLQSKVGETRAKVELLVAQHRRHRALTNAAAAAQALQVAAPGSPRLTRLLAGVREVEEAAQSGRVRRDFATVETLEERLDSLERSDQIEALLLELKERQPRLSS